MESAGKCFKICQIIYPDVRREVPLYWDLPFYDASMKKCRQQILGLKKEGFLWLLLIKAPFPINDSLQKNICLVP